MKILTIPKRHGAQITLIYLVVSAGWIFFSDRLIASIFTEETMLLQMQTYKGFFFILVTSGLLYYMIDKGSSSLFRSRERLEATLRQKQILLSELHHRVKNNLAIISGLIELQLSHLNSTGQGLLKTTQYRIHSLANIQELLFREKNLNTIPFHEYLQRLVQSFNQNENIQLSNVSIDPVKLNVNQAVPLGLLINEFCSQIRLNGSSGSVCSIEIELAMQDDRNIMVHFALEGVPDNVISRLKNKKEFVEATLVDVYTRQLKASSGWEHTENGITHFNLLFEKSQRIGPSSGLQMPLAS